MTNYVTVTRHEGYARADGKRWFYSRASCICDSYSDTTDHAAAIAAADEHARICPAVRLATERDEWADVAAEYPRMVDKVVEERDHYKAALDSCEAAYAADMRRLKAERDDYRNRLYDAQGAIDVLRLELDATQDRRANYADAIASESC